MLVSKTSRTPDISDAAQTVTGYKDLTYKFLKRFDLPAPLTFSVKNEAKIKSLLDKYGFSNLVLKQIHGQGGEDVFLPDSNQEFEKY